MSYANIPCQSMKVSNIVIIQQKMSVEVRMLDEYLTFVPGVHVVQAV